ncbi:30S ribosomal protein S1 [Immundisolibacter sp.]|uniref:30S ribosomal protein S1 n=1 Tax=Immundisolibacter sp. TaxID=1934948 RepID=UPI002607C188|nr:30S ribosomal protein S1 [Immundisolibacter sp.]MDD3650593.1 30S ribosomal protein S1 [Immundisolibacter sp.]
MSESFAELLEESLSRKKLQPGAIIKATVVDMDDNFVTVNAGLKSEALIPIQEFRNERGELECAIGDTVEVALKAIEDGYGETQLSREEARLNKQWAVLEDAFEKGEPITGIITDKVKGGFTVMVGDVRAFLPGSLVDIRPVRDVTHLEGREIQFKVIKLDRKRNNVVVSRRAVLEDSYVEERRALIESLEEGQIKHGVVKNLTDYGAFVDLGGIDGLLHVTDMAWKRVRHPSEVVKVGDELDVKILKFDRERVRVSLGLKQLQEDPWVNIARRYPVGTRLFGTVTNVTDYGCFVEIEDGVEGLVHMSEMDWTNRNVQPSKVVQPGDQVEVMILDVDSERRRISLGMKQCRMNPWEEFAALHRKGDKVSGRIKSITDFGVFVELEGGIDGLVHLTDISWDKPGEEAIRDLKKGDLVNAVVLLVDPERERISLGMKQVEGDAWSDYVAEHPRGTRVTGKVVQVEPRQAVVELAPGVEGTIRAADVAQERVKDATEVLKVGDEVEAMIIAIDGKSRSIQLSVRAQELKDEAAAVEDYRSSNVTGTTSLGDLLKEQLGDRGR